MEELSRGVLLVAMPTLADPNFRRTVVLVCDFEEDGSLGLVLNRPTPVRAVDYLPEWEEQLAHPPVVFIGGPVQPDNAVGLARRRSDRPLEGWTQVVGATGLIDLGRSPGDMGEAPLEVRVFSGYGGWGPGQLQAEVAAGDWAVVDSRPGDLFLEDAAGLWGRVLGRQSGRLAFYANFPDDPRLN